MASKVALMFRIDIGFAEDRGYAAVLIDAQNSSKDKILQKGVRGNSMEQLASRLRHVLIEEAHKRKNFPLESEPAARSPIIMPGEDPLFNGT